MLPQVNPYYFQQSTYQPIMYQQTASSLNGRMVDSFDSITANDVPMSGISIFPTNDLSQIAIKRWTPQGTIQTNFYKAFEPTLEPKTDILSTEAEKSPYDDFRVVIDGLKSEIETLNSKIDKLMPTTTKKGAANEPKSAN